MKESTMENIPTINVLIADDQQLLLLMYRQVLIGYGMTIVGEAKTPEDAVILYKQLHPHVVLTDIRFGTQSSGFDLIKEIMDFDPLANIVTISQFDHGPYISRAYALGVKSFLTKDCDSETLFQAVKKASIGERFHMQAITDKVMNLLVHPDPDPSVLLSEMDFKIFMLLAEGKTNNEVAEETGQHINFVSLHRQKIQDILKIDRPQQFSRLAIKCGLMVP